MRDHTIMYDTAQQTIGQVTFQTIARLKAYPPLIQHEYEQEAVVVLFITDTPLTCQLQGKILQWSITDRRKSNDGKLNGMTAADGSQPSVHHLLLCIAEQACFVRHESSAIGKLDVRYIFRLIYPLRRYTWMQQKEEKGR